MSKFNCLYKSVCSDQACSCALADHTKIDRVIYDQMHEECMDEYELDEYEYDDEY